MRSYRTSKFCRTKCYLLKKELTDWIRALAELNLLVSDDDRKWIDALVKNTRAVVFTEKLVKLLDDLCETYQVQPFERTHDDHRWQAKNATQQAYAQATLNRLRLQHPDEFVTRDEFDALKDEHQALIDGFHAMATRLEALEGRANG